MKLRFGTLLCCLVLTSMSLAQDYNFLNGFKYALVSPIVNSGSRDAFGVESKTISALEAIGLRCLKSPNAIDWPDDAQIEPCLIVYITVTEGIAPNSFNCGSVRISIKNCKNELIKDELVKSKNAICSSPYECCFYKWSEASFTYFTKLKYQYNPELNMDRTEYPAVEKIPMTEESIKDYLTNNTLDPIEGIYKSYQREGMPYYKFGIIRQNDKFKAIIFESTLKIWNPGEVKAIFEPSSMLGFYSVRWYRGNKLSVETFGNIEKNAALTIELTNPQTGVKTQDKFIKLFPVSENLVPSKKDNSIASGSGFFLTNNGIIATNAHVIEGASKIEIVISNEIGIFKYKAKVLIVDSKNDVALLQIEDADFKGLSTIPYAIVENCEVGTKVFTIGYPLNDIMGSNFKVTDGIISSKSGISDDIRYYQVTVPLQPGNSGGPLFNNEGSIIGIVSAKLNSKAVGTQVENVNYAIKSSYLLNLYNMLPNTKPLSSSSILAHKDLKDQVKIVKNFVCLINVY